MEHLLFEAVDLFGNAFEILFDCDYGGESGAGGLVSAINSARNRAPDVRWNRGGAAGRASCWRRKGVAKNLEFEDMVDVPRIFIVAAGWFPLSVVRWRVREEVPPNGLKYCEDSVGWRGTNRDL